VDISSVLNVIDPTVELVGVALVAGTFVAWWWLTLPMARINDAERRYVEERHRSAQRAAEPQEQTYRPREIYRAKPYTGQHFPGRVPYTATIGDATDGDARNDIYGMPLFVRSPQV
jgi:hypothetical protein